MANSKERDIGDMILEATDITELLGERAFSEALEQFVRDRVLELVLPSSLKAVVPALAENVCDLVRKDVRKEGLDKLHGLHTTPDRMLSWIVKHAWNHNEVHESGTENNNERHVGHMLLEAHDLEVLQEWNFSAALESCIRKQVRGNLNHWIPAFGNDVCDHVRNELSNKCLFVRELEQFNSEPPTADHVRSWISSQATNSAARRVGHCLSVAIDVKRLFKCHVWMSEINRIVCKQAGRASKGKRHDPHLATAAVSHVWEMLDKGKFGPTGIPDQASTWIETVTSRFVLDYFRKWADGRVASDTRDRVMELEAQNKHDFHLRHEELLEVFAELSPDEKELVQLHYFENMGFAEIAVLLEISVVAAIKRHHRLKRKLRSLLADDTGEAKA